MEDDLVISFQLLLCTLEFCIKRCPPELLQPLYSKSQDPLFAPVLDLPLYVSRRLTNGWCSFYCSESAVSKVQSPPARTARRSQSKAKSRPPEPEMDLQLLKTLCQENDCNSEEVGGPHPLFNRYTIVNCFVFTLCVFCLFYLFTVDVGEECVPDQFLSFPGLARSVRSTTISSGREVEHLNTCSAVCLALHLHFHSVPPSAPRCHRRASV